MLTFENRKIAIFSLRYRNFWLRRHKSMRLQMSCCFIFPYSFSYIWVGLWWFLWAWRLLFKNYTVKYAINCRDWVWKLTFFLKRSPFLLKHGRAFSGGSNCLYGCPLGADIRKLRNFFSSSLDITLEKSAINYGAKKNSKILKRSSFLLKHARAFREFSNCLYGCAL